MSPSKSAIIGLMTRRTAIRRIAGGAALAGAAALVPSPAAAEDLHLDLKDNIHQSVCRWCYNSIPLEPFCKAVKDIGLHSIDLLGVNDFPLLKKYGLVCAMVSGVDNIPYGFNRLAHHDHLVKGYEETIPLVAKAGFPNIICFSGKRRGMSDEEGLKNCEIGVKRAVRIAEKYKVTLCMELLNSKVDHKDYMCDHSAWGVELCKRVGSDRFKLLYDIYHMQIMEGDIIRTIRENHQYFGHYHTGGVPGRHEIDQTQELYYPAVMRGILATGYKGYVAQEFLPKRLPPLQSLKEGVHICDV